MQTFTAKLKHVYFLLMNVANSISVMVENGSKYVEDSVICGIKLLCIALSIVIDFRETMAVMIICYCVFCKAVILNVD